MLKKAFYFWMACFSASAPVFASGNPEKISCISVYNQVALRLGVGMSKYIVTHDALVKNKCPAEIFYSIEAADETEVNGWKVFYGKSTLKDEMTTLSLRNKELFLEIFEVKLPSKDDSYEFNTFQLGARHIAKLSDDFCGVYLDYEEKAGNIDINLSSINKIPVNDFCYSIPTILAVNNLKLVKSGRLLKIVLSKSH